MFCKYCGKEIEDDSKFCKFCGNALTQAIVESSISKEIVDDEPEIIYSYNTQPVKKKSGVKPFLIALLIVFVIFPLSVFIIYKISSNSDSSGNIVDKIVERNITSSDYDITKSEGLTSISFTITPRVKMNTCTIEFKLLDSKENIVYSDTISKSDLMKGSSYIYIPLNMALHLRCLALSTRGESQENVLISFICRI